MSSMSTASHASQASTCGERPLLDVVASVQRFQTGLADLPQLLFVSDDEVAQLTGSAACGMLHDLEKQGVEERLCATCGGICCRDVGCELYAVPFQRCPIQRFRPLACRFHFCHRFGPAHKAEIVALRDLYLACYMLRDSQDSFKLRCLDAPPLAQLCPELVSQARPIVTSIARGTTDAGAAMRSLEQVVEGLRKAGLDVLPS